MKKTFTVIALLTVMIFNEMLIIKPANALVHVDGYIKGNGTYVAPHWNGPKSLMAIKQPGAGQKTVMVEINTETLRERTVIQDVDAFTVISRRRSNWKIKTTP